MCKQISVYMGLEHTQNFSLSWGWGDEGGVADTEAFNNLSTILKTAMNIT
jgi:hypothetical protein